MLSPGAAEKHLCADGETEALDVMVAPQPHVREPAQRPVLVWPDDPMQPS